MNKKKNIFWILTIALIIATVLFIYFKENSSNKNSTIKYNLYEKDLDIVYGQDSAKLAIYLFSDYSCAFCRKFFVDTYPKLKQNYIQKGIVKLVVKPVNLTKDEYVMKSLQLAVCINRHGNFEQLNELLLKEPNVIYTDEFSKVADDLALKDEFVAECLYSGESEKYIISNYIDFISLDCKGTPTFIIENTIYKGYMDFNEIKKIIENNI